MTLWDRIRRTNYEREKDVTPIHAGEEEKMQSLDSLVYQIPERSVNKTAHSDLDSLFSPIHLFFVFLRLTRILKSLQKLGKLNIFSK